MPGAAAVAERTVNIETARVFLPLLEPARYKGAHGGRGSAKSHFFAENLIDECLQQPTRAVCIREVQRSLKDSVKRLLEDKIEKLGVGDAFEVTTTEIRAPRGGVIIFQGMQDHTAESIKSLEGFRIAWVEEAQSLSERSLTLLRPTIREPNSEIWCSWNPRFPSDPVDRMLRGPNRPPNSIVVRSSFRDNPWFPAELRAEMEWDRARDVDKYNHVWEGGYESHSEARVFRNWTIEDFETPADAQFLLGGDWGFATDPTTLLRLFIKGRKLFIDQELYRVGLEIDATPHYFDALGCQLEHRHASAFSTDELRDLARAHPLAERPAHCQGWARQWAITTDSARPETINYMRSHGYPRTTGARKGPNSVKEGVEFLKTYDIVIHPRCTHTIDEFTHYSYRRNELTDEIMPLLEDAKNHIIDPARYAVEKLRRGNPQAVKMKGF